MQNWNFYKVSRFVPHSLEISGIFCQSDFMWNHFGESRSSKTAIFYNFRSTEFCSLSRFQPSKSAKIHEELKFRASKGGKCPIWRLHSATLISHKIWVTEKFYNFHTVYQAIEFDKPERWNTYLTLLCLCTYISWNLCWVALRESAILNMIFLFT